VLVGIKGGGKEGNQKKKRGGLPEVNSIGLLKASHVESKNDIAQNLKRKKEKH